MQPASLLFQKLKNYGETIHLRVAWLRKKPLANLSYAQHKTNDTPLRTNSISVFV